MTLTLDFQGQFLPLRPSGWRGIVVMLRVGGRAAAKLVEPISL